MPQKIHAPPLKTETPADSPPALPDNIPSPRMRKKGCCTDQAQSNTVLLSPAAFRIHGQPIHQSGCLGQRISAVPALSPD